jgi:tetratricopeptide (TPR) repeat protein
MRRFQTRTHVALAGALTLFVTSMEVEGGTSVPPVPAVQAPAQKSAPAQKPAPKKANPAGFDTIVKQAEEARGVGRLDEAIGLYRKALALKPDWSEGQFNLGTALYELDRYAESRDAFRQVLQKHDEHGLAWALKGLCEYKLKNYDSALSDLLSARARGVTAGREVAEVARYHTAILFTRVEQYEQALSVLSDFALEGNDAPRIIEAMGLAALRMPLLPEDLPGARRELVMMAGRARYFMAARLMAAAQNAFEALVARYPDTPNVHYAFGVFLLSEQPEKAVEQLTRELKVAPNNVWAKIQIAFAHIRRGEFDAAKPWAEQSVAEAPTEFVARNALGQVLLETGDVNGAIRELEAGVKLAPDSPVMYFALARALRRAGRTQEADKAQAEFTRLDRLAREQRTGVNSVGGVGTDPPIKREPR